MKKLKQLKTQTNEDFAMALSDEFASQLIKSNVTLIKAIDSEDYVTAARIRDYIQTICESITTQTAVVMGIPVETLRTHYSAQNDVVFARLNEQKNAK